MSGFMGDLGDLAAAAARGAAAGSIVPGLGTVAGGAIGVAMELLPGVAHWLGADDATAAKVVKAVQAVTGAVDPAAQRAAVAADPGMADDLRVQLAQIAAQREDAAAQARTEDLKAALADVANARSQTIELTKAGSSMAWGTPVVSVIVLLSFGVMLYVVLTRSVPESSMAFAQILLGALAAMATGVVNYWTGSNAGSARKTDLLANSVPASLMPNPAAVVPAGDVQPAR